MLTDEQKEQLCAKVVAKAAEFAANPEKGRLAGYRQEQKYHRGEPTGMVDEPARIPLRDAYTAWLFGVAARDLGTRHNWRVLDNPEGVAELVII